MILRRCSLFVALAVVLPSVVGQSPGPRFVDGNPGQLRCRIVKASKGDYYQVLEVEVSNRTSTWVEPLRFVVQARKSRRVDKKSVTRDTFDRARSPLVARFGRGIPPGKARRYRIQTSVPKQRGVKVSVSVASFFEKQAGVETEHPIVRNLAVDKGHNSFTGRTHTVSSFEVHNPFERTADIWLRATYKRPTKEVALLAYRVRGKQTRKVTVGVRAPRAGFDDSGTAYAVDTEITDIEVVDWLQIGKSDQAAARAALLESLDGWARWPSAVREIRASFESKEVGPDLETRKDIKLRTKGQLVVGPNRKVRVTFDAPSQRRINAIEKRGMGLSKDTEWMVRLATWQLRRPATDALRKRGEVVWMTPDSLLLRGLSIDPDREPMPVQNSDPYHAGFPRLGVRDRRITSDRFGTWATAKLGSNWVLATRRFEASHLTQQVTETWKHGQVKGVPVVDEYRHLIEEGGDTFSQQILSFSDWEFVLDEAEITATPAASAKAPPAGPGAAELGAAWARIHQLDAKPVRWSADLHIVNHGRDAVWQGFDRFDVGITATCLGRTPTGVVFDMKGRGSSEVESALASVLLDRVRLWFVNDLQTKGAFDSYFGGATISEPDRRGWLRIKGHRASRVRIRSGFVTEVEWSNGIRQRFHYEQVDGVQMITRIERNVGDDQELLARFERHGEGIVPVGYEFRAIFGKDWGPEIFTIRSLKVLK